MSEFRETLNKKAVALTYDEDKQNAPVIVASGMGYMAEKIVEIASENGVPVYEDDSLATVSLHSWSWEVKYRRSCIRPWLIFMLIFCILH